ncbi:MAG TPA: Fic family protein [Gammaproteobacteria bacterium]|nr:Fic family protein [Gammaproteobacteria bacterium]
MKRPIHSSTVGYQWLVDRYQLHCLPHDRVSMIAGVNAPRTTPDFQTRTGDTAVLQTLPRTYARKDRFEDHLELALKHEGLSPGILKALFKEVGPKAMAEYVRSTPTGRYARRAWFFYEWLLGQQLDVPDLRMGTAVEVVDSKDYYTARSLPTARYRVIDNVAGVPGFCPMFRRSGVVDAVMAKELPKKLMADLSRHSPEALKRALNYLYAKESRTSFLIEREVPAADKAAKFIKLLREAGGDAPLTEDAVINIQAAIIDEKALDYGYGWRPVQGYVGEKKLSRLVVHLAGAKPGDVPALMQDIFAYTERVHGSEVPAIVQAAAVAFGFVFIHPLEDGNGRAHRYLIHHVLERENYTPKDIIFPLSAAILKDQSSYDACLETFSKPLMRRIDYTMNDKGKMSIKTEHTADLYRYFDGTPIADFLASMVELTAKEEVVQEVAFIEMYDRVKEDVKAKFSKISDKTLDLAIKLCHQGCGRISQRKSDGALAELSEPEISYIEQAYANHVDAALAAGDTLPPRVLTNAGFLNNSLANG